MAPVAFIGAVAPTTASCEALREAFELEEGELLVPRPVRLVRRHRRRHARSRGAAKRSFGEIHRLNQHAADSAGLRRRRRCRMEHVVLLRDRVRPLPCRRPGTARSRRVPGHRHRLGLDEPGGDRRGRRRRARHLPAHGGPADRSRPAGTDRDRQDVGRPPARSAGVGTTGSGRELIAELVGRRHRQRRDHRAQDRRGSRRARPRAASRWTRSSRSAGRIPSTSADRERRGRGLHDERSLRRRHRLVPRGAGREAGHQHQGRVRRARAVVRDARRRLGERCTVFMERDVTRGCTGRADPGPGRRPGLLDRAQLPEPGGARAGTSARRSTSRAARPTTTRWRRPSRRSSARRSSCRRTTA